jgi:hypothetical protein
VISLLFASKPPYISTDLMISLLYASKPPYISTDLVISLLYASKPPYISTDLVISLLYASKPPYISTDLVISLLYASKPPYISTDLVITLLYASKPPYINPRMKINPSKCKAVRFTRARVKHPLNYTIGYQLIPDASICKYLGIIFRNDLNWGDHVNYNGEKGLEGTTFHNAYTQKGQ